MFSLFCLCVLAVPRGRTFVCGAEIDGDVYDLGVFVSRRFPEVVVDEKTGRRVVVRMCGGLTENDAPGCSNCAAASCNGSLCYPLAENSREYRKIAGGVEVALGNGRFVFRGKCNKAKVAQDVEMNVHMEYDGSLNRTVFEFEHVAACPSGAVREAGTFYPPFPQPGRETPVPSPNPVLFVEEDDSYVVIDLSQMDSIVRKSTHTIHSQGETGEIKVYHANWVAVPCPRGYKCEPYTEATWWSCWVNESGEKVCFPIADKRFGVTFVQQNESISSSIHIRYQGQGGIDTEVIVSCSHSGETTYLPLAENASFHVGLMGYEYGFQAVSALACPRKYQEPVVPPVTPSPSPDPNAEERASKQYQTVLQNGTHIMSLDLTLFESITADVVMGWSSVVDYEKTQVKWAPHGLVSCIDGYDCSSYENSSAWKCWQQKAGNGTCIPIGDLRYGFEVKPVDMSRLEFGFQLDYDGGLGGFQTRFIVQCNESIPDNALQLVKVAHEYQNEVIIYAQTGQVCQGHSLFKFTVTPGAIFLLTVSPGLTLYFFVGVLVGMACRSQSLIPNHKFWSEFLQCVKFGGLFIFTCNRVKPDASDSYRALE